MKKSIWISILFTIAFLACSKNKITGRKQLKLFSESALQGEAKLQYQSFLTGNKVLSTTVNRDAEMVKRVGLRISKAITEYYTSKGLANELEGYIWEFNLVEDAAVNAWCMPGGKVVVYTGLLPVAQNEAALAVVMGHEIAHAVSHHGNERMSQSTGAELLNLVGNIATSGNERKNQVFNQIFAPGAQIGFLLPNSRKQELESDRFGLIFAALAGYNPNEAIPFWQRMSAAGGGQKPPEFLSTHPDDATRIQNLQTKYVPEALNYYKPIGPVNK